MIDLEMRFTTTTANASQSDPNTSLGGYRSTNTIFSQYALDSDVAIDDVSLDVQSAFTTHTPGLVSGGPEIFSFDTDPGGGTTLSTLTRGLFPSGQATPMISDSSLTPDQIENIHILPVDGLFSTGITTSLVQYRCVSIICTDSTYAAINTSVILMQDPNANVQIDVGIEVPKYDIIPGTNSVEEEEVANNYLKDAAFVDQFEQDYFKDGIVNVTGHGTNTIFSYDPTDGSFILTDEFDDDIEDGTAFTIHPAPCQTVANETVAPSGNSDLFFGFLGDGGSPELGYGDIRARGGRMIENDVFYLWIKRTLTPNVKSSSDTGVIISVKHGESS